MKGTMSKAALVLLCGLALVSTGCESVVREFVRALDESGGVPVTIDREDRTPPTAVLSYRLGGDDWIEVASNGADVPLVVAPGTPVAVRVRVRDREGVTEVRMVTAETQVVSGLITTARGETVERYPEPASGSDKVPPSPHITKLYTLGGSSPTTRVRCEGSGTNGSGMSAQTAAIVFSLDA